MTDKDPPQEQEEESKTPDKKQIEAEEREKMLKEESTEPPKIETDAAATKEGPVKTVLANVTSNEGREVKPKYIPIGGIKMPGFFTRANDKEKKIEDETNENNDANELNKSQETGSQKRKSKLRFSCPFTQFLHSDAEATDTNNETSESNTKRRILAGIRLPLAGMFRQSEPPKDPEAALASLETLDDKLDTPNDGLENVKLDKEETEGEEVPTKLPFAERVRQKKFIMDDLVIAGVVLVLVVALVIGVIVAVALRGPLLEPPLRNGKFITTVTSCGPVEGILAGGAYNFYGIPYAVPPVEERRWTNAQPLNAISLCWNGTLKAHNVTPPCLQILENGSIVGEEDCLRLDVVTPQVRYDSPLPVVVLIGADTLSGGIGPLQPSPAYARSKEVVFIKVNFRLGPFGFLALEALSKSAYPEVSGNYGLSDIIVALQWVQLNAKHFGGDPAQVTLFGHRGGATLASVVTSLKSTRKLYARAWLSSGSTVFPGLPLRESEIQNEVYMEMAGCDSAACLRALDVTRVLSAMPDTWRAPVPESLPAADEPPRHSWLVLDGDLLRVHPYEGWEEQRKARTPVGPTDSADDTKLLVFGATRHSAHSDALRNRHLNWTATQVEAAIRSSVFGSEDLYEPTLEHYNRTYAGLVALTSAVRTVCPLLSLARLRLDTAFYVVTEAGAGASTGLAAGGADVAAVLGAFEAADPEARRFVAAAQQLFYYFVWHGRLPAAVTDMIDLAQDALPLAMPDCDFLIMKDLVPRYAHID